LSPDGPVLSLPRDPKMVKKGVENKIRRRKEEVPERTRREKLI
jgi:hypothetical protein